MLFRFDVHSGESILQTAWDGDTGVFRRDRDALKPTLQPLTTTTIKTTTTMRNG